jgi:outer membrane protein assembly factor BamD (BamD/ComL family)
LTGRGGFALALLLSAAAPAAAQISPEEQARTLLEAGRQYWTERKLKQALDNFNTIVSGFPATTSVDDALLEIGRYYLEVEGQPEKAREAFDQVAKRFPQSDGAPGAYYYLGWLGLGRATAQAELDDALAQFDRVQRLYPGSQWVPRALYAAGLAHRRAGRLPEAVESERRASLEYPTSDAAPAAQFEVGHCLALMGEPRLAMEEYQQVRNRFPSTPEAGTALDRITALYRLFGGARPAFTRDASYQVAAGDVLKDVRAILMTPGGTLWIASEKSRSAVPLDPSGKIGASVPAEDLRSLAQGPRGDVVVTAKMAVRIGPRDVKSFSIASDKAGVALPLDDLTAVVPTPNGGFLVADQKRKRVYRFDGQLKPQGTFPDAREREVIRLVVDGEGGIALLDREERTIRVFDETGRALRVLGPRGAGYELRKPVDLAIDAMRNTYLADEEAGVLVFSPQGELLATVTADDMKRPKAIALDPSGAILVYDGKLERILRFK